MAIEQIPVDDVIDTQPSLCPGEQDRKRQCFLFRHMTGWPVNPGERQSSLPRSEVLGRREPHGTCEDSPRTPGTQAKPSPKDSVKQTCPETSRGRADFPRDQAARNQVRPHWFDQPSSPSGRQNLASRESLACEPMIAGAACERSRLKSHTAFVDFDSPVDRQISRNSCVRPLGQWMLAFTPPDSSQPEEKLLRMLGQEIRSQPAHIWFGEAIRL